MSRRCEICGKKPMIAVTRKKLRGKYNPTGKRKKYPNLQWVSLSLDNEKKRVKACTKCIRTLSKSPLKKKTEK